MEEESQFEKGTRELKEIREKLRELEKKRSEIQRDLVIAREQRQKLFGDIALGLGDLGDKAKINQEINQLEQGRDDLNITIKELEVREERLDRGGFGFVHLH